MRKTVLALCIGTLLSAFPVSTSASTITFGTSAVDHLSAAGTLSEAGFTYAATGAGWELETDFAVSGAALATFFDDEGPSTGDKVEFSRTGGGTFTFSSLSFRTIQATNSDHVTFTGFLGGTQQALLAINTSNLPFATVNAVGLFGNAPLDLLRITVTTVGTNAMLLDNLVLTPIESSAPVPEPTTLSLLGLGLMGAAVARSRRRR